MISNEQIAHDLTIIYMRNLYAVDISGDISTYDRDVSGSISTSHFPSPDKPSYKCIKTGEKGWFGLDKTITIQDGYEVDDLFDDMIQTYFNAYSKFYQLVCNKQS